MSILKKMKLYCLRYEMKRDGRKAYAMRMTWEACIMERQKKLQDLCIQPGREEGDIRVEHGIWRDQVR